MATGNYSQEVVDQLQAGIKKLGADQPDLKASTSKGLLSSAYTGTDDLSAKLVSAENDALQKYVMNVAKQFVQPGEDPAKAVQQAMMKIKNTSAAAKSGKLVVGPGTTDYAAELANQQVYQMMATLLTRYAELKSEAKKGDFEEHLNKVNPPKGSKQDRLAVGIAGLVQSAHKILTKDPGYNQFINQGANGPLIHDIVTKVKNKDAPTITIAESAAPKAEAPAATAPKGPPPIPAVFSDAARKQPPPLPMFQHKAGSPGGQKVEAGGPKVENEGSPPVPPRPRK
jgi:hypothetical protein